MTISLSRPYPLLMLSLLLITSPLKAQDTYGSPSNGAGGVNYETRLSSVEDQLRALTGKAEQLEYSVRRMDQTLQKMQADYEARLAKLEALPMPPVATTTAPAPKTESTETQETKSNEPPANLETAVSGTLGGLKLKGEKVTGAVSNPKSPPLPDTPKDYGLNPQEQYDRAFGLLRQASYDDAEKAFKSFIDKNPQDKLIDNAKYWYAETFYVRTKYSEAAAAFADAYEQNPKGTKAPDSLLKLAMSLSATDKIPDACTTLDALKNRYPNAPATIRSRADQERSRIKCKK